MQSELEILKALIVNAEANAKITNDYLIQTTEYMQQALVSLRLAEVDESVDTLLVAHDNLVELLWKLQPRMREATTGLHATLLEAKAYVECLEQETLQ